MEPLQAIAEWLRPFWGVWLMGLFLIIVGWTLWPKRKAEMEQHARIPLEGDDAEM
jgi:cytochrome c oxidase cbb3-type subunit 4